jgi:hypothetical protein
MIFATSTQKTSWLFTEESLVRWPCARASLGSIGIALHPSPRGCGTQRERREATNARARAEALQRKPEGAPGAGWRSTTDRLPRAAPAAPETPPRPPADPPAIAAEDEQLLLQGFQPLIHTLADQINKDGHRVLPKVKVRRALGAALCRCRPGTAAAAGRPLQHPRQASDTQSRPPASQACAMMYFKRYFLAHSPQEGEPLPVLLYCLFLAGGPRRAVLRRGQAPGAEAPAWPPQLPRCPRPHQGSLRRPCLLARAPRTPASTPNNAAASTPTAPLPPRLQQRRCRRRRVQARLRMRSCRWTAW